MATATITTTIEFPTTLAGMDAARLRLDELAAILRDDAGPETASKNTHDTLAPDGADDGAACAVYHAAGDGSRTRELLKALPGDDEPPLTFVELADRMRPQDDGNSLRPEQLRAVHRNEKRIEGTLKSRGVIPEDRLVIHQEWDDAEGVGRYYVTVADRDVLRSI